MGPLASTALPFGVSAAVAILVTHRMVRPRAQRRMDEIWRRTGVTLGPEPTARLLPVMARRTAWPMFGGVLGYVVAFVPTSALLEWTPGAERGPWGPVRDGSVLSVLLTMALCGFGAVTGSLLGHLVVGHRSFPRAPDEVRSARASARRPSDYVAPALLSAWRLSSLGVGIVMVLDALVLPVREPAVGLVVLALLALTLLLAGCSWLVLRALLDRPLPSTSRDELVWREAALSDSLQQIVGGAALSGLLAFVTGVGAVYLLLHQVPLWAAAAAVLLGVTGTAACGHVAWRSWRHPSPPALQWRGVPG
jgi:hypothetical protein